MGLRGTLRDFGVADILQLISHQGKTGVLRFDNDVDEISVYFHKGSIVRAENQTRPAQMLLGNMMLCSEVITPAELDRALREHRRTLKRIGNAIIDLHFADQAVVASFARLQMTETIYTLFEWRLGRYEFETKEVGKHPDGLEPLSADTVVMNGIRMADEWPLIREKLPSYSWIPERVRPLEPAGEKVEDEFNLDGLAEEIFGESGLDEIGPNEHTVFDLIDGRMNVQKIVDLSRLGEFEACRALSTLMTEGNVRVVKPVGLRASETEAELTSVRGRSDFLVWGARAALSAVLTASIAMFLIGDFGRLLSLRQTEPVVSLSVVEDHTAAAQAKVLLRALEVFRVETGKYPESLEHLVQAKLISSEDLSYPFTRPYVYYLKNAQPVLLPPLF